MVGSPCYAAPEQEQPLLDVGFQTTGRAMAVGAYGLYLDTQDEGRTWTSRIIASLGVV